MNTVEFEGRKKVDTRLSIAPLIDVVFLLLIFFMLSSRFVTGPGIKLNLPAAVTVKLYSEEDLVVYITGDNLLYLNEDAVDLDNLPDRLRAKIGGREKKTVVIRADKDADLGLAVKVMDIAGQAGAQGLVISTREEEDDD